MFNRSQVVATARTYIGTPFAHQGRVKGNALDCVGLPLCIAGELGLRDKSGKPLNAESFKHYSSQPLGNYVHEMCMDRLTYKPIRDMRPGDIISLKVVTAACHVAIVSEIDGVLNMIHAYNGGPEKCVEHVIDEKWRRRIVGCFHFPEVE